MYAHEKIILFDGSGFDKWTRRGGGEVTWENDGEAMTVVSGDIVSKVEFSDALLHVEFKIPDMPDARGQDKGNSGVYVHGCYEIQVLDSYGVEDPKDYDCGGIYSMYAPLTNACKKAEEWQTYDIIIRAPRFDGAGELAEPARMTVLQNSLPVQSNIILERVTPGGLSDKPVKKGPVMLQDHGNRVSFRNVWLINLE